VSEVALSNGGWNLQELGHELRDPTLTYSRYSEICADLGHMHYAVGQASAAIKFAIGDAILMGEQLFREEAYQAIEEIGASEEVRRECVRVAAAIPRSRRRLRTLTWSHHRAVAAIKDVKEQEEWLKRAEREHISHHALRDALRPPREETKTCECCGRILT
jgi:hypothetical protein